MFKRNILCLLLAAALLVQPISLRTWADEATEETHLLAKLIYVEARGESEDGQQAIAEVVLNRYTSGLFGKSLSAMIQDEDAFVPRKLLNAAKPTQAQYEAIDRALYGPYVLPKDVLFYGRVRTTDSEWGSIGGHIFCYPRGYMAAETN